jgi:hypothetical protein
MSTMSMRGDISDPGPANLQARYLGATIFDPLSAISIFRDDPRFYNLASYLLCTPVLFIWAVATLRKRFTQDNAWLAFASIAALSMLPVYHRLHDTRLLLLVFPAFARVWSRGGLIARLALLFTGTGAVITGAIPVQQLAIHSAHLRDAASGLSGQVLTLVFTRPVPLILLILGIFYLWVYLRHTSEVGVLKVLEGSIMIVSPNAEQTTSIMPFQNPSTSTGELPAFRAFIR